MKKKIAVKKDVNIALLGVIICLLSLLVLFSGNTVLSFLSNGILISFGFVGFWILIPSLFLFGLYLILRRKLKRFRIDISLWGIFLIVLAFLVLSSSWGSERYEFAYKGSTYVISMFSQEAENIIKLDFGSPSCIDAFQDISKNLIISNTRLGGGFVGYALCGALNNAITPIGMTIVCWVLIVVGILLILNRQIKKLFLYISSSKQRKAAKEDVYNSFDDFENDHKSRIEIEPLNVEETINKNNDYKDEQSYFDEVTAKSFNNTHGLKDPTFFLDGEEIVDNDDRIKENIDFDIPSNNETINEDKNIQQKEEDIAPNFSSNEEIVKDDIKDEYLNNDIIEEASKDVPLKESEEFSFEEEIKFNDNEKENIESNIHKEEVVAEVAPKVEIKEASKKQSEPKISQPKAVIKPVFNLPSFSLLDYHENDDDVAKNDESTQITTNIINQTFTDFGIGAEVIGHTIGPSVTRYDVKLKPNVLVSSVTRVMDNLAINLSGKMIRFERIVPGKPTSGLEIPNDIRTTVGLREAIEKMPKGEKYNLSIPLGKGISGEVITCNIKKAPHLLVGGGTGSGKSIFMHSAILSLIMRNTPETLRLLLIDPKKVELNYYDDIPHLICPNISEGKEACVALKKLVDEMERRYALCREYRVREISEFNVKAKTLGLETIPYIVIFIDEYAELNEMCKEIRDPVVRLAQKARAAGIHLVIATQRPTVNVIDGVIKANLPCRIALKVSAGMDSQVILDEYGAEMLLGNGDMIVSIPEIGAAKPRVQGCFVDNSEIDRVCDYLRAQGKPNYFPEFLNLVDESENVIADNNLPEVDTQALKEASEEQLFERVKEDVMSRQFCSISFIQRTYGVGFPKAGRLFNRLIKEGYVEAQGDSRGSKVLKHEIPNENEASSSDSSKLYIDSEN